MSQDRIYMQRSEIDSELIEHNLVGQPEIRRLILAGITRHRPLPVSELQRHLVLNSPEMIDSSPCLTYFSESQAQTYTKQVLGGNGCVTLLCSVMLIYLEAFRANVQFKRIRFSATKSANLGVRKSLISRKWSGANSEAVSFISTCIEATKL